jgi:hypothetical protein
MLEDMEALFSLDNTPGNVPDTGSNCFCFPDIRSQVMGLHVLQDDRRISSSKIKEKSLLFDSKKASELLFEPSSLHKYSSGMREMKLEYFFGENEDEPLVSTNILPFLGPNSNREREGVSHIGASASSSSSNNSNYSLGHNNHSTSTGSVAGSSSSTSNSNSNSNSSSYFNSNINIISTNSSASNITSNTSSSHHGNGANSVIPPNQYGSLQNTDIPHTPKRPAALSLSLSPPAQGKGGTEHSTAYSSGASEESLGYHT